MGQRLLLVVVAGLLIAGGWSVGRAQRNVAAQGNVAEFVSDGAGGGNRMYSITYYI